MKLEEHEILVLLKSITFIKQSDVIVFKDKQPNVQKSSNPTLFSHKGSVIKPTMRRLHHGKTNQL